MDATPTSGSMSTSLFPAPEKFRRAIPKTEETDENTPPFQKPSKRTTDEAFHVELKFKVAEEQHDGDVQVDSDNHPTKKIRLLDDIANRDLTDTDRNPALTTNNGSVDSDDAIVEVPEKVHQFVDLTEENASTTAKGSATVSTLVEQTSPALASTSSLTDNHPPKRIRLLDYNANCDLTDTDRNPAQSTNNESVDSDDKIVEVPEQEKVHQLVNLTEEENASTTAKVSAAASTLVEQNSLALASTSSLTDNHPPKRMRLLDDIANCDLTDTDRNPVQTTNNGSVDSDDEIVEVPVPEKVHQLVDITEEENESSTAKVSAAAASIVKQNSPELASTSSLTAPNSPAKRVKQSSVNPSAGPYLPLLKYLFAKDTFVEPKNLDFLSMFVETEANAQSQRVLESISTTESLSTSTLSPLSRLQTISPTCSLAVPPAPNTPSGKEFDQIDEDARRPGLLPIVELKKTIEMSSAIPGISPSVDTEQASMNNTSAMSKNNLSGLSASNRNTPNLRPDDHGSSENHDPRSANISAPLTKKKLIPFLKKRLSKLPGSLPPRQPKNTFVPSQSNDHFSWETKNDALYTRRPDTHRQYYQPLSWSQSTTDILRPSQVQGPNIGLLPSAVNYLPSPNPVYHPRQTPVHPYPVTYPTAYRPDASHFWPRHPYAARPAYGVVSRQTTVYPYPDVTYPTDASNFWHSNPYAASPTYGAVSLAGHPPPPKETDEDFFCIYCQQFIRRSPRGRRKHHRRCSLLHLTGKAPKKRAKRRKIKVESQNLQKIKVESPKIRKIKVEKSGNSKI